MTDLPRAVCIVCFARWPAPGQRKCGSCDPRNAVPNNTAPKRFRPKPVDLSLLPDPTEADLAAYLNAEISPSSTKIEIERLTP